MRDLTPPAPYSLRGDAEGDTADAHYWLIRVDCATRRYRTLRNVLANRGALVDSMTQPATPMLAPDPADPEYGVINAVCGGPPRRRSSVSPLTRPRPLVALHRSAPEPRRSPPPRRRAVQRA